MDAETDADTEHELTIDGRTFNTFSFFLDGYMEMLIVKGKPQLNLSCFVAIFGKKGRLFHIFFFSFFLFRCAVASLYEVVSVRP